MGRYEWTEAKHRRFLKEGRGSGQGVHYRPWYTVHDVPSRGRSSRITGMTIRRKHHLLSDLETFVFLEKDYAPETLDIREQFPLDREETRSIADGLGIPHPRDPATGIDVVMTTDLVVDSIGFGGRIATQPIFIKYAQDLDNIRTVAKFQLERAYWRNRGLSLLIRTEKESSKTRAEVIAWMSANHRLDEERFPAPYYWSSRADLFVAALLRSRAPTFEVFEAHLRASGFLPGEALAVLRHVLSRRRVLMKLDQPFSQRDPLSRFVVTPGAGQELL